MESGKNPARPTVEFRVETARPRRWLTGALEDPRGTWTDDVAAAAVFRFWRSPTHAERARILVCMHELAGGLDKWNDIASAREAAGARVSAMLGERLWGGERPETEDPDEIRAQDEAFGRAWALEPMVDADGHTTPKGLWVHLDELYGRIDFMARWSVLATSVPPGWSSIADVPLDDVPAQRIQQAWLEAYAAATMGKT